MARRKLIPKEPLPQADTVAYEKKQRGDKRHTDILFRAARAWDCMDHYRKERERNKRYMYGDQWGDPVEYCGRTITEEEYIRMQGNIPLKNNLIRRLARVVIGVYRNQQKTPVCIARDRDEQKLGETMSTILEYNNKLNDKKELDARMFDEFLIGGLAVQKEVYSTRGGRQDCWTDNVNPNFFFMDGQMNDIRMDDVGIIGELHDITFGQLASAFAHSDADLQRLEDIYKKARNRDVLANYVDTFHRNVNDYVSFLQPYDLSLCRVIEVWTQEQRKALWCHDWLEGDAYIDSYGNLAAIRQENAARMEENRMKDAAGNYLLDENGNVRLYMPEDRVPLIESEYIIENYWYYRFLSPFGDVLEEGESPYAHGEHPYTAKAYPYIDGEIHPFVADIIDQQRYINHYIILNDFIVKASAKGVLVVDEGSIPDDMNIEDIAEEWTRFNGVIKLKLKEGAKPPQQLVNSSKVSGLQDMIQMQMQLMDDVSGVHGALQGKQPAAGTSGVLYQQQANNASTSVIDLLETYSSFLTADAKKKLKNIQQFYDEPMTVKVAGKSAVVRYDPQTMGGIDFDLAISESYDTPVYRALNNELLLQLLNAKQITIEQMLQVGAFPFGDRLLQLIQAQKRELEQQQQMLAQQQGAPPARQAGGQA